jgi:hypothetical protein
VVAHLTAATTAAATATAATATAATATATASRIPTAAFNLKQLLRLSGCHGLRYGVMGRALMSH